MGRNKKRESKNLNLLSRFAAKRTGLSLHMKTTNILLIASGLILPCAAQGQLVDFDGRNGGKGLPSSIPAVVMEAPPAKLAAPAEWTVMVYVNAKNNLEASALKDINEMETAGSTDKVNILVEAGRMAGYDASDGDWKGTRRYRVIKDADMTKINSPVLENLGNTDMGDHRNAAAFGRWAKTNYPARHYLFIIWNHGSGWVKKRGISYDDESGNHMTVPQMAAVLRDIGGVDLYASDACLMQMAEVAYEIKEYASFIAGSEETEPTEGYAYDAFLGPLVKDPSMTAERLGRTAVDSYVDQYEKQDRGSTHSLLRTSGLDGLASAAAAFSAAVKRSGDKAAFLKARDSALDYSRWENKDFYDMLRLSAEGTASPEVKTAALALMEQIKDKVVVYSRFSNSSGGSWWLPTNYDNSNGLAVYLPSSAAAAGYDELRWARDSGWAGFIDWLAQP